MAYATSSSRKHGTRRDIHLAPALALVSADMFPPGHFGDMGGGGPEGSGSPRVGIASTRGLAGAFRSGRFCGCSERRMEIRDGLRVGFWEVKSFAGFVIG